MTTRITSSYCCLPDKNIIIVMCQYGRRKFVLFKCHQLGDEDEEQETKVHHPVIGR